MWHGLPARENMAKMAMPHPASGIQHPVSRPLGQARYFIDSPSGRQAPFALQNRNKRFPPDIYTLKWRCALPGPPFFFLRSRLP
jgi:hypothetical protein